jgi:hypothetical protein
MEQLLESDDENDKSINSVKHINSNEINLNNNKIKAKNVTKNSVNNNQMTKVRSRTIDTVNANKSSSAVTPVLSSSCKQQQQMSPQSRSQTTRNTRLSSPTSASRESLRRSTRIASTGIHLGNQFYLFI